MGLRKYFYDEVVQFDSFVCSKCGAWMPLADLEVESVEHRLKATFKDFVSGEIPVDGEYVVISVRNKMCPCHTCRLLEPLCVLPNV